jgi:hypothetical protein
MSGPDESWSATVATWAHAQPDIRALVQIGSRVQLGATVDPWSDYDYHLVTSRPGRYADGSFCREFGPCWAFGAQTAFGNALKVTGVYAGALEADFVVLRHWEVRVAAAALSWPASERLWPAPLRAGVANLRIVAAPGWKVIKGGGAWEKRYARLRPLRMPLSEAEFNGICGVFWTQLVWTAKKAQRGEFRAAQRAFHLQLVESALRMLQEGALQNGRQAFPLGRHAEAWLTEEQRKDTAFGTAPDRENLLAALGRITVVFELSSLAVAAKNGWTVGRYPEARAWLTGLGAG